jgi:hypothetical protein
MWPTLHPVNIIYFSTGADTAACSFLVSMLGHTPFQLKIHYPRDTVTSTVLPVPALLDDVNGYSELLSWDKAEPSKAKGWKVTGDPTRSESGCTSSESAIETENVRLRLRADNQRKKERHGFKGNGGDWQPSCSLTQSEMLAGRQ